MGAALRAVLASLPSRLRWGAQLGVGNMEPRVWGSAELVCEEEPEVWAVLVVDSLRAPGCALAARQLLPAAVVVCVHFFQYTHTHAHTHAHTQNSNKGKLILLSLYD